MGDITHMIIPQKASEPIHVLDKRYAYELTYHRSVEVPLLRMRMPGSCCVGMSYEADRHQRHLHLCRASPE